MVWFKYMLFAFVVLGAIRGLLDVRKGDHQRKETAFQNAIGAVINTLFAFGIWYLL